jgi:octaprenyl-diphosphate synthase
MDPEYTKRLEKIEDLLGRALPAEPGAGWMAFSFPGGPPPVPPALVQALTAPGRDLLNRGGKRWRPLLMTLVCEALGGGDGALPLTPLVELSHNASLIHDDIEDNSDERRGKPALHLLYGSDTAINSGCFLYFLAPACIDPWELRLLQEAGLPSKALAERKNHIYALWGDFMRRLHLGQAMDIAWHRDFSSLPGLDDYHTMCRLKTGVLARLAAELGVYAAGGAVHGGEPWEAVRAAETALAARLGAGAEQLGVGFQILDDVKNLTAGNPGKKRGDDVVEGKKSLPVLLYLHRRKDRAAWAARCFTAAREQGTAAGEVEELIEELDAAGVLEEAREAGLALIREGRRVFETLPFSSFSECPRGRQLLAAFTDLLGSDV